MSRSLVGFPPIRGLETSSTHWNSPRCLPMVAGSSCFDRRDLDGSHPPLVRSPAAALAMGSGALATIAKMFVLRPRPNGLNLNAASYDSAWLWAFDWNLEQVATFDAGTRAFPSGSIATAIAFTVGLWFVLPRGRWPLPVAVSCRLRSTALLRITLHERSFGGASLGLMWHMFASTHACSDACSTRWNRVVHHETQSARHPVKSGSPNGAWLPESSHRGRPG